MTHSEIIDKLGGTATVARLLEVKPNNVSNWKLQGIPWRYRNPIGEMLLREKIAVPDGFLG